MPCQYPAFCILNLVAKDRSLFAVRAIVSVWCSGVGFALGYTLLKIGVRHIEATSELTLICVSNLSKPLLQTAWATVIHMSPDWVFPSHYTMRLPQRGSNAYNPVNGYILC